MGVKEKLAHAMHSHDLSHKEQPCDVDKLAAVGMAGVASPIIVELLALKYAGDHRAYRPALDRVTEQARLMSARRDWRAHDLELRLLAKSVLDDWLAPNCRTCNGMGFRKLPDAPTLEARPCPACHGTGRQPLRMPRKLASRAGWERRWRDLSHWLLAMEMTAAQRVKAKLSAAPPKDPQ